MGEDVVEEFAAGCVFEDDAEVFIGFYDIVEADDVGVFESLGRMLDSRKKWRNFIKEGKAKKREKHVQK